MIHTTYHKGQQQTGSFKDNIRFLSAAIGELLLDYIVTVIPLRQSFLRQSEPKALISPYLWFKDGKVWPDNRLTRCIEAACARAEVPRLHLSNWRQMTVAIVKTKFAANVACFDVDEVGEEDAEEIEDDIKAMTKQRNHTSRTVNRAYVNQNDASFGNVWDGLIRRSLRASTLWQDFWGLDSLLKGPSSKRGRLEEENESVMPKKIAAGLYRPRKPWAAGPLLEHATRLYRKQGLAWKSCGQEQAVTTIMSLAEQVVVVLPTGIGKSLCFMLPCSLPDARVTVLVLPLVSLRGDMMRRLRELAIRHLEWFPGETRDAPLVIVSAEAACTKDFMAYAQNLVAQQALDRIVIDECHLTVTAAEYRGSMFDLPVIRGLRTQFVYLTATLPPTMQAEFEERNHLQSPKSIRASSNRPNLFFMVRTAEGPGSLLEQAAWEVQEAWQRSGYFDWERDKIIIYVREKLDAAKLAAILSCPFYHAEIGTAAEKEEVIDRWLRSDRPYIVATSALSAGFDYPYIRLVFHVDEPYSTVDFAQEFGRAGRDGQQAYSFVLLPSSWTPQPANAWDSTRRATEKAAMHRYLAGKECFRTCLSDHLDLPKDRRWCMLGEDVACDICKIGHKSIIPPKQEARAEETMQHTGEAEMLRKRREAYLELSEYEEDLIAAAGTCMLCRAAGEAWDHRFGLCQRRHEVFRARDRAKNAYRRRRRKWIQAYMACFWCYNPQAICQRADQEQEQAECRFSDIVLPLCYGIFQGVGSTKWLLERFGKDFEDIDDYMIWLGDSTTFGGEKAINAVKVAGTALRIFRR
jgi:superfamily II DNA helicase RecQ